MRYDCIIIGTGPAGLEAALNLKIRNKNFTILGKSSLSSKLNKAPKIDNYLGFPGISGNELTKKFATHLKQMDISVTNDRATMVYPVGDYFSVATTEDILESTTIILAPGVFTAKPYVGEEEFLGRGVGYCATCDAPLYKGKKVIIIGSNEDAQQEANFVSELTDQLIYVPVGAKPTLLNDTIDVVNGKITGIVGNLKAEKLVLEHQEIEADGIFILRDNIAPANLIPGIETDGAHIKVDHNMATNIPGCFAAGDCTGVPYQYIRAAGQGLVAAYGVTKYLGSK